MKERIQKLELNEKALQEIEDIFKEISVSYEKGDKADLIKALLEQIKVLDEQSKNENKYEIMGKIYQKTNEYIDKKKDQIHLYSTNLIENYQIANALKYEIKSYQKDFRANKKANKYINFLEREISACGIPEDDIETKLEEIQSQKENAANDKDQEFANAISKEATKELDKKIKNLQKDNLIYEDESLDTSVDELNKINELITNIKEYEAAQEKLYSKLKNDIETNSVDTDSYNNLFTNIDSDYKKVIKSYKEVAEKMNSIESGNIKKIDIEEILESKQKEKNALCGYYWAYNENDIDKSNVQLEIFKEEQKKNTTKDLFENAEILKIHSKKDQLTENEKEIEEYKKQKDKIQSIIADGPRKILKEDLDNKNLFLEEAKKLMEELSQTKPNEDKLKDQKEYLKGIYSQIEEKKYVVNLIHSKYPEGKFNDANTHDLLDNMSTIVNQTDLANSTEKIEHSINQIDSNIKNYKNIYNSFVEDHNIQTEEEIKLINAKKAKEQKNIYNSILNDFSTELAIDDSYLKMTKQDKRAYVKKKLNEDDRVSKFPEDKQGEIKAQLSKDIRKAVKKGKVIAETPEKRKPIGKGKSAKTGKEVKITNKKEIALKCLAGFGGVGVGLALSAVPIAGQLKLAISVIKLGDLGTKLWAHKHPNGKIAKIRNGIAEVIESELIDNHPFLEKLNNFRKSSYGKWLVNGIEVGYIAGNVIELATGKSIIEHFKPEPKNTGVNEALKAKASSAKNAIEKQSQIKTNTQIEPGATPAPTPAPVPTPAEVVLEQGKSYDISSLTHGYSNSYNGNSLTPLMTSAGKDAIFDGINETELGTMARFKQPNGSYYAWFKLDDVKDVIEQGSSLKR